MKKREIIYKKILFLIGIILLLFTSTASAAAVESGSPTITETQITTTTSDQWSPDIYSDRIVWVDNNYGNDAIYMYDLSTKKEAQITTNTSGKWNPAIYSDRIVWTDDRDGWSYIYMYDLATKKEIQIPTTNEVGSEEAVNPAIYGDKIVWAYRFEEYSQIYMYDLSTSKEIQISDGGRAYNPAIYGNKIVWLDDRDSDYKYDIYMYDLSTKKETQITTSGSADNPAIYGNRIVYADGRKGNYDIYMYDLSTKKETQITSSPDNQVSPDIYGNRILWKDVGGEDDGGEYHGIYMCDLSTNQKFKITSHGDWNDPAIYGNRVVYTDNRNGNYDIYMSTISSEEPEPNLPVAAFSASPISGKSPLNVKFTDKSTGTPKKWKWDFGDRTTSTKQNPTHKYSKAGVYTVKLTVTNAAGSNPVTKSNYITVTAKPVAAFSASPISGRVPLNVKFTDTSTGTPTKWKWDFGDGTISTKQNPTHKYSKAGKYTVTLKVTNAAGINTVTKSKYITVAGTSQAPVADFWGSPLSGKAPLKVTFTEISKGSPTSWKWDFGDGKYSTEKSPKHTYSAAGTYTVKLTATNAAGSSTKTKWKYIKVAQ